MAASYPTSIKSFTTKVDNVDDVLAAHVNDLQDEVVALENACGVGKIASVIQIVNTQTGALATGTTTIPYDDSIPQVGEGDQYMSLAITPKVTTHKLKIDVVVAINEQTDFGDQAFAALFKSYSGDPDPTNAVACGPAVRLDTSANSFGPFLIAFSHYMTAPVTTAITFTVRAGCSQAGTVNFNGSGGVRKFGGALASSITITEYEIS